jgi:hypothetical protein
VVIQHSIRPALHWQAVRLAAQILFIEIAVVVAALVLWGLLSPLSKFALARPIQLALAGPTHLASGGASASEACVHLGRAGGRCPAGVEQGGPDAGAHCDFLGRAGRFCPPVRRNSES